VNRVINPATEQVIAEFAMADVADAQAAIARSIVARRAWVALSISARREPCGPSQTSSRRTSKG
jgi:aldehyde dehydrogenase (NAD+)/betaine-aldehyde dehydrogenase